MRIEGDIVIQRPIEEVFDFVADERNEPRYNPQMTRAEKVSPGPIGLGTKFKSVMNGVGGRAEMTIEFTEFERRRIAEITHLSNMDIKGALLFDPVPEGTRMTWLWDIEPRGFYRLLGLLVRRMGERQERAIWTGLKWFLESQQTNVTSQVPGRLRKESHGYPGIRKATATDRQTDEATPEPTGNTAARGSAIQLGFWVAILTVFVAAVFAAVGIATPARSAPFCQSACVAYPYVDVARFIPGDYLWLVPGFLLAPIFVVLVACIHAYAAEGKKIFSRIGLSFAVAYAVVIMVNYFVEFTVVTPSLQSGETQGPSRFFGA